MLPCKQALHLLVEQEVLITGAIALLTIPASIHCFAVYHPNAAKRCTIAMCDAVQSMQGIRSTMIACKCKHPQAACRPSPPSSLICL